MFLELFELSLWGSRLFAGCKCLPMTPLASSVRFQLESVPSTTAQPFEDSVVSRLSLKFCIQRHCALGVSEHVLKVVMQAWHFALCFEKRFTAKS